MRQLVEMVAHMLYLPPMCESQTFTLSQVFKVEFVAPYAEQLQKLAADQTLREAMTGFVLGSGADSSIAPQHRAGAASHAKC